MAARELAALLRSRLRASDAGAGRAFTVAELRRSLLPYPLCRERLELASKAEYDVALLGLLAEGSVLEVEDGELLEDVREELDTPEPGLGVLDDHAAASVRLAGAPPEGAGRDETPPSAVGTEEERPGPAQAAGAETAGAEARCAAGSGGAGAPAGPAGTPPGGCPECGTGLPDAEGVRYCPACGADVAAPRCGGCGRELDPGWRYCPFCGSENGV